MCDCQDFYFCLFHLTRYQIHDTIALHEELAEGLIFYLWYCTTAPGKHFQVGNSTQEFF